MARSAGRTDEMLMVAKRVFALAVRHHPRPLAWDVCIALGRKDP